MNPNNFSLEYAKDETNALVGAWYPVSGMPVFPFSFGSLLDERLDEAYVTIVRDTKPIYESNTLFRVGFHKHGIDEKTYAYYICASDNAHEMPIGSGKYTHKLYLIEATKRLEGIMCQSLTFTDNRGKAFGEGAGVASNIFDYGSLNPTNTSSWPSPIISQKYRSPSIKNDTQRYTYSAEEIVIMCYNKLNENQPNFTPVTSLPLGYRIVEKVNTPTRDVYTRVDIYKGQSPSNAEKVYFADTTENALEYTTESIDVGLFRIRHQVVFYTAALDTQPNIFIVDFEMDLTDPDKVGTKPYTVADCVDRVLGLAEPIFADGAEQNTTPRYKLDPAQKEWLKGITAPPFTMTQCTLREQLRVIGGYIHAEPRLMFNEEAREYDEENAYEAKKFYVHFDKFNSGASTALRSNTPYIGRTFGQDINQYCTKIETSASNLVNSLSFAKGVIAEPNQHQVKTLRTETVNVRIDETSGVIATTYPIYEIEKVEFMGFDQNGGTFYGITDITPYIYEKTEYDANLTSFGGGYPYSKSVALYYAYGQKGIKGLFFKPQTEGAAAVGTDYLTNYAIVNILSNVLTNDTGSELLSQDTIRNHIDTILGGYPALCFRVTYVPVYSARFSQEKPYYDPDAHKTDYMQVYNQSENVIDSKYYGENVKGVAARLGNVEQERTYIFDSLADLPRAGDAYKDATGSYVISAVNTEYKPFYIKTTVALSRGFNRLSQYIGVNSTKRVYEVSEREAYRRSVHIKEFVVLGQANDAGQNLSTRIFKDVEAIKSIFDTEIKKDKISAVNACGFSKDATWGKEFGSVTLPVVASAFGNSMLFSWSYKDNYSAGEQASYEESGEIKGYYQKDVPYGDFYGRAYWYYFYLFGDIPAAESSALLTRANAFSLPQSPIYGQSLDGSTFGRVATTKMNGNMFHVPNPLLLRKDSREALDFSFAVEFVSRRKDIRIGSALAQCCYLVSGKDNHAKDENGDPYPLELVLLREPLSEFDNFVTGNYMKSNNITTAYDANVTKVIVTLRDITTPHWAVITPRKTEQVKRTLEDGTVANVLITTGGEVIVASTSDWEQKSSASFSLIPVKNLY